MNEFIGGILVGIVFTVVLSLMIVLPLLKRRKIPVSSLVSSANRVLSATDEVIQSAEKVLPPTPVLFFVDKIIAWAQVAVNYADQIYRNGKIEKCQRKDEALCFLRNAVISSGMEVTPEIQTLIEGSIEACVRLQKIQESNNKY